MTFAGRPPRKIIGNIRQTHSTKNGIWYSYDCKLPKFPSFIHFYGNILSVSDYNYLKDKETDYLSCQWHYKDNTNTLALINNGHYYPTENNTSWHYILKNNETEKSENIISNVDSTSLSDFHVNLEWYNSKEDIPTYGGIWTINTLQIIDLDWNINKTYEAGTILSCEGNSCLWGIANQETSHISEYFLLKREFNSNEYSFTYAYSSPRPLVNKMITLKTKIPEIKVKNMDFTLTANKGRKKITIKATWSL